MEENRDIKHLPACCVCSRQYDMKDDASTDANINVNTKINTNVNTNINTNIDIFIIEQMMNKRLSPWHW